MERQKHYVVIVAACACYYKWIRRLLARKTRSTTVGDFPGFLINAQYDYTIARNLGLIRLVRFYYEKARNPAVFGAIGPTTTSFGLS